MLGGTLKPGVAGYITAQGRTNPYDSSGFVFIDSLVYGSGKAFLGRPWRSYARVIFYNTDLTNVVVPQGWESWHLRGHESQLTFAEIGCYGSGSNTGRRVSWVKKLSRFSVQSLVNLEFINSGGWVQALPIAVWFSHFYVYVAFLDLLFIIFQVLDCLNGFRIYAGVHKK